LLKEWAYAGFFFAMSGAVVSHMASDDSFINYLAPLIFAILTVLSWWLRPANRKLSFG
jgi:membrane protein DedA with SNARE-associated domain